MNEENKQETGTENETDAAQTAVATPPHAGVPELAHFTSDEVAELKARADKADEYWDRLLRQTADFDNYKKRAARERQDAIKYANEALLEKLIPIIDNFEMAIAAAGSASQENLTQALRQGVEMICSQFKTTLMESGLEEVDAAGKTFDPNLHEAVAQEETADAPEGHVVQQLRKGYKLRDRLIRPATVIVAKQPGQPAA